MADLLPQLEAIRQVALENSEMQHNRNKQLHDRNSKIPDFQPGTKVWLFTNRSPAGLKVSKLHIKNSGPFYIVSKDENGNFRLRNCETNNLVPNPVHPNRLKLYNDNRQQFRLPETQESNTEDTGEGNSHSNTERANTEYVQAEKLIGVKLIRGRRYYRVCYKEQYKLKPEWIAAEDIPDQLKQAFHINKTLQGTTRKRPQRHRTSDS
jgi:hypothetical protein